MPKISILITSLLLSACVTINIYFPAAAAEEAARVIVRDVLQGEEPREPAPTTEEPQAYQSPNLLYWLAWSLERLVPTAHAGANININTPAIAKIRRSMAKRQKALAPFYRSGAIGFDQNGLVAIRNLKAVPLNKRNQLKKLVADENKNRNALYREIARANGHPEWEKDIRKTFARIWIEEAPKGYWYKTSSGWKKK